MAMDSVGMIRKQAPTLSSQAIETFLMIAMQPGITASEIAKRLDLQGPNISKNLSTMMRYQKVTAEGLKVDGLDWIRMETDPVFRARKPLYLTDKGQRLIDAMSEHALQVMARGACGLTI